jgi:transmembrane sensor
MSDPTSEKVEEAFRHIQVQWDGARTEDNLRLTHQAIRRRGRTRVAASALLLGVVIAMGVSYRLLPGGREAGKVPSVVQDPVGHGLRFFDGSSARMLDDRSQIEVVAVTARAIDLRLTAGRGEFDVVPDPGRTFAVHVDGIVVRVLGTRFRVEREGRGAYVSVYRGKVEVRWPSGARVLAQGQTGHFPEEVADTQPSVETEGPSKVEPAASVPSATEISRPAAPASRAHFRALATRGRYADAYRVLAGAPGVVASGAEDLMLAADAARLSGHPAEATPYLQQIVRKYRGDERAPLAAFTLGRILLYQLERPAEAADAFALVRKILPEGPLSSDALAREAEAANRAGQRERARGLAEEYGTKYPTGRRLESVRRYGQFE